LCFAETIATKSCARAKNSAVKALFLFTKTPVMAKKWNKKDEIIQKISLAISQGTPYNSGGKWLKVVKSGVYHRDRGV
jgi:hypothetical protein